jgi:hypothetical protein
VTRPDRLTALLLLALVATVALIAVYAAALGDTLAAGPAEAPAIRADARTGSQPIRLP